MTDTKTLCYCDPNIYHVIFLCGHVINARIVNTSLEVDHQCVNPNKDPETESEPIYDFIRTEYGIKLKDPSDICYRCHDLNTIKDPGYD